MLAIQSIRKGNKEVITLSEIAEDIISLPLARENMTEKEYNLLLRIYAAYKKNEKKYALDYKGLIKVEASMVGSIKKKVGNKEFTSFYDERECVNRIVEAPEKKDEIIEEYLLRQKGQWYDPIELTNNSLYIICSEITLVVFIVITTLILDTLLYLTTGILFEPKIQSGIIIVAMTWTGISKKGYLNIAEAKRTKIRTKKEAENLWIKILIITAIIINATGIINGGIYYLISGVMKAEETKGLIIELIFVIAEIVIAYRIAGSKYIQKKFSK